MTLDTFLDPGAGEPEEIVNPAVAWTAHDDNIINCTNSYVELNTLHQWGTVQDVVAKLIDVETILVHEIGHIHGLAHPNMNSYVHDETAPIMAGGGNEYFLDHTARILRTDDINGTRFLQFNSWVPSQYATVQAGLANAFPNSTINVNAGTHAVTSSLQVNSGLSLKLFPGVIMNFNSGCTLTANGKLEVAGTAGQRVTMSHSTGSWGGVVLTGATGSSINYCTIEYATSPLVVNSTSALTVYDLVVQNASFAAYPHDAAIAVYGSSPNFTNVRVYGQWNSKNGIRFASGSAGTIFGGEIANCGAGNGMVLQGNSNPILREIYIHNNYYHGVVIPQNGSGIPELLDNTITYNGPTTSVGVIFDGSDGFLRGNTISNNAGGLYAYNQSCISSGTTTDPDGANIITNNGVGLFAYNYSDATFGIVDELHGEPLFYWGACNQIYSNVNHNAAVNTHSTILAEGNWWGSYPPNTQKFSVYNGDWLIYDYPRELPGSTCGEYYRTTASDPLVSPTRSGSDELRTGLKRLAARRDDEASQLFLGVLSDDQADEHMKAMALVGLLHTDRRGVEAGLETLLAQHISSTTALGDIAREISPSYYAGHGRFADAVRLALQFSQNEEDREKKARQLGFLASLAGFDAKYARESSDALQLIRSSYADLIDEGILAAYGSGEYQENVEIPTTAEETLGDEMVSAFPNPFNPATRIRFRVNSKSRITLKLYDVLGRHITDLFEGELEAGEAQVEWRGDSHPSGIYFCRYQATNASGKVVTRTVRLLFAN